jgi:hypothetical protein
MFVGCDLFWRKHHGVDQQVDRMERGHAATSKFLARHGVHSFGFPLIVIGMEGFFSSAATRPTPATTPSPT